MQIEEIQRKPCAFTTFQLVLYRPLQKDGFFLSKSRLHQI